MRHPIHAFELARCPWPREPQPDSSRGDLDASRRAPTRSHPVLNSVPSPLPLYQIDADLEALEAAFLDADGETDDDTSARYDALLDARDDKHAACLALVRRNAATADAYRTEADRLARLARAHAATVESVKRILLASMLARGEHRVETPIGRVAVQRSSTQAVVLADGDPATLPERFRVVTIAADKRALAEALRADDPEALAVAAFAAPMPFLRLT